MDLVRDKFTIMDKAALAEHLRESGKRSTGSRLSINSMGLHQFLLTQAALADPQSPLGGNTKGSHTPRYHTTCPINGGLLIHPDNTFRINEYSPTSAML